MPRGRYVSATVLQQGLGGDVPQVPRAVLQLVDSGVGRQVVTVVEHVRPIALGLDRGRDVVERVLGHEVVQVQVAHIDIGIVADVIHHQVTLGVYGDGGVTNEFHEAAALTQGHIGGILSTVSL